MVYKSFDVRYFTLYNRLIYVNKEGFYSNLNGKAERNQNLQYFVYYYNSLTRQVIKDKNQFCTLIKEKIYHVL